MSVRPRSYSVAVEDEPRNTQDPDIAQDNQRDNLVYEIIGNPTQLRRLRGSVGPSLPVGTLVILDKEAARRPIWFATATGSALTATVQVWES